MKPERFKRTKSVMASGAIALVVAALAFGVSSTVLGSRSAVLAPGLRADRGHVELHDHEHAIYPSGLRLLGLDGLPVPGDARCVVFSVHNNLKAAISVQSMTTALDTTNYPAPPADCSGTNLVLPTFSGSFNVSRGRRRHQPWRTRRAEGQRRSPGRLRELHLPLHLQRERQLHRGLRHLHGSGLQPEPLDGGPERHLHGHGDRLGHGQPGPGPLQPDWDGGLQGQRHDDLRGSRSRHLDGTTTATAHCTVTYATRRGARTRSRPPTSTRTGTSQLERLAVPGGHPTTIGDHLEPDLVAQPLDAGSSVTFTATVSSGSGTPTGSVTFYSCTTSACAPRRRSAPGRSARARPPCPPRRCRSGTTYVEAVYGGLGQLHRSTSNVVTQVVKPPRSRPPRA